MNDFVLPTTPFPDAFETSDIDELKYLRKFAEQLQIDEKRGMHRFRFAAITILINDRLAPHVDAMNPRYDKDYTMAFSIVVPLNEVPAEFRGILKRIHPKGVPLCVVVYRRRCLEILSKRRLRWNSFVKNCKHQMEGRHNLLKVITAAHTYSDFVGVFWSKINRHKIRERFSPQPIPNSIFGRVLSAATFPEAVDKMVRYPFFVNDVSQSVENLTYFCIIFGINRATGVVCYMYFTHM